MIQYAQTGAVERRIKEWGRPVKARSLRIAAAVGTVVLIAGCTDPSEEEDGSTESFTIGITQIVSHPALDASVQGFKDALEDAGLDVTYDEQNAQGESSNAATIAGAFAADDSIDLVLAVATPSAQAVVSAISDTPVLFAAVTDPVAAGLVSTLDGSGTNVSGASDLNPEANPIGLIREIIPDVSEVGVIYSSAEVNSQVQVEALEAEAAELGVTIRHSAITNSSEVAVGAQALDGVDAIYVPTDNTVVSALEAVIDFAQTTQTPLFAGDSESVSRGAIATRGLDYYEMGYAVGEMAVQILRDGVDVGTLATLVATDTEVMVNVAAAEAQGVTLSEEFLADATVLDASSDG